MVWVLTPFKRGIARPTHVTFQCRPPPHTNAILGLKIIFSNSLWMKNIRVVVGLYLQGWSASLVSGRNLRIVGVKLLGRRVGAQCARSGSARVAPAYQNMHCTGPSVLCMEPARQLNSVIVLS